MHRRMLGNGHCARPVDTDCHFEPICEGCTFMTRKKIMREQTEDLVDVVAGVRGVPGKRPEGLGGECDLLALDDAGNLLAAEVKPRGTSSIRWAAAQATVHARLLRMWLDEPHPPAAARDVIDGMLSQRAHVGLARADSRLTLADDPKVIPMVAVQRGAAQTHLDGWRTVQRTA